MSPPPMTTTSSIFLDIWIDDDEKQFFRPPVVTPNIFIRETKAIFVGNEDLTFVKQKESKKKKGALTEWLLLSKVYFTGPKFFHKQI